MTKRMIAATTTLLCLSVAGANAQAFGVKMGKPLSQMSLVTELDAAELTYKVNPPEPNPLLTRYVAFISKELGVCEITGSNENRAAHIADRVEEELLPILDKQYGQARASFRDGKKFGFFWTTSMPPHVMSIELRRDEYNTVSLTYTFENYVHCKEFLADHKASGL